MQAIVLSGGGGKGAYELGFWRALRKLRIKYDIVTGTSIGALNGLLMAQGEYYKGLNLWSNINFDKLYDNFDGNKMYKSYFDKIVEGGIDTSKIEALINSIYNSKRLYNSKIRYGVVSVNLKNKQPVYSTNINTKEDVLSKYILASATCFPFFKPAEINNELFIDGGYYDNLPINLAINLGAKDIIAVDLGAVGLKKEVDKKTNITYIKPNNKLDSFLKFDKNVSKKLIKFGYNDTMKVFKKLEGNMYTFKKGSLDYNNKKFKKEFQNNCLLYSDFKQVDMNTVLENALYTFNLDATKIYKRKEFNKILLKKIDECPIVTIKDFDIKTIKKALDNGAIVKYIMIKILNGEDYKILKIFKKEFLIAIYLITIRR